MTKILLECSYLSEHPNLNSGIQRVIRNVAPHLEAICKEKGLEMAAVSLADGGMGQIPLKNLKGASTPDKLSCISLLRSALRRYYVSWRNVYIVFKHVISKYIPVPIVSQFLFPGDEGKGLDYYLQKYAVNPIRMILFNTISRRHGWSNIAREGDILVLMDGSWHMNIWPSVKKLKSMGVKIWVILYDLIPIRYPQFCDPMNCKAFGIWLDQSIHYADGFLSISKTVEEDFKKFVTNHYSPKVLKGKKVSHFYLGADFSPVQRMKGFIRREIKNLPDRPTYIMVATLEPRKNHGCLLEAFHLLWAKDMDLNLCLVGRIGWKADSTLHQIYSSYQWQKKLYWWKDVNDAELEFLYSRAKALITTSKAEGFGLPVIEGLMRGKTVMASDIPAHREIGEDMVHYFNPDKPKELARLIKKNETNDIEPHTVFNPKLMKFTWHECSRSLLEKIVTSYK